MTPPFFVASARLSRAEATTIGSVGVRVVLDGDRHLEVVELGRVLPRDPADVLRREVPDLAVDDLLRPWPGGVAVGVVGLEEDVLDADALPLRERGRVLDRA